MKTIKQIKFECINLLKQNNVEDSNSIVSLIMQKELNCNKQYLLINDNENINEEKENIIREYITKVIYGTPIEYITNNKEFMNCNIYVNENVLIPRQDTEVLVESIIKVLNNNFLNKESINILDMCTGSCCISVGLLTYLKENNKELFEKIQIVAADISKDTLEVAKVNIEKYSLSDKITLVNSDLFNNIKDKFDIIVSNPPYIKKNDIKGLDNNVKHEPILALDGGIDGLDFYNKISSNGREFLIDNGYILYEIGYDQANDVKNILENNRYKDIKVIKDLSQNDRVVIAIK